MYRFALAVALVLAAGWSCGPAYAAGDVLVPSDNSSTPNPPANGQSSLPVLGSGSGAPQGQTSTPTPSTMSIQSTFGVSPSGAAHVIEVPVIGAQVPGNTPLPNSLQIAVSSNSVWGSNDTSTIQSMLGISPNDVPNHCHLAADGIMATVTTNGSIDAHTFDTGVNDDTVMHYAGKLTGVNMHMEAFCDLVPLPANSDFILKMGDNYLVYLSGMACDTAPNNTVQHMIIQYAGNGVGKCVYE